MFIAKHFDVPFEYDGNAGPVTKSKSTVATVKKMIKTTAAVDPAELLRENTEEEEKGERMVFATT